MSDPTAPETTTGQPPSTNEPDPVTLREGGVTFGLREAILLAILSIGLSIAAALYHL